MILPASYSAAIVCLALSMLCWGSWANFQKLAGKWRYELFYWDFSIGVAAVAIIAALTLGLMDSTELSFEDNLLIASYHKIAYAVAGGIIFNLANVLLVAAVSVAPMAVVFPIAMGLGLVIGVSWTIFPPQGSILLLLSGAGVVLAAVVVNAFTYSTYAHEQRRVRKPLTPDPRTTVAKPPVPAKGIALSVLSGIVMGMVAPLVDLCRSGEDGLGAYSAGLLFGIAALLSTVVYTPFFIAFPVHGAPVQVRSYFQGTKIQHLYGLVGGGLWSAGLFGLFLSGGTLAPVQAGLVATRGFAFGAAVLAALWGFFVWREFRGGTYKVRILLTAMLILWAVGASMVTIAPNF